jgi:hypothetical protein
VPFLRLKQAFFEAAHLALRGRVLETDHAAHDTRRRAASAMPEDLIALAHQLTGKVKEPCTANPGLACQRVALAMGHERELAGLQPMGFDSADFQPARSRRHDMEHQAVLERRQLQGPWRGELGTAVKGTAHPQEMERLTKRVRAYGPSLHQAMAPEGSVSAKFGQ